MKEDLWEPTMYLRWTRVPGAGFLCDSIQLEQKWVRKDKGPAHPGEWRMVEWPK